MAKQDAGSGIKQDEFSKIFDEYRAKIEEITRRSEKNLRSITANPDAEPTETESADGPAQAEQPAAPSSEEEPETAPGTTENIEVIKAVNPAVLLADAPQAAIESSLSEEIRPDPESYAKIIQDARREAKKIIEAAEESAHKEAKKRTQNQADKIIEKARREAAEIIDKANRNAEKLRTDLIAELKREADSALREITQKCRQDAEAQSAKIMTDSREKARRMLEDVSISTTMVGQRIAEIVAQAKKTAEALESGLQAEAGELTRIVAETQGKLEAASKTLKQESASNAPSAAADEAAKQTVPTLAVRLIGEKRHGNNGSGFLFKGQLAMKSISNDFDYRYLKNLKKYLGQVGNIKYLQEYASEKELSATFDVLEPMPLLEVLKNIPELDEAVPRADDYICLVFKS